MGYKPSSLFVQLTHTLQARQLMLVPPHMVTAEANAFSAMPTFLHKLRDLLLAVPLSD